MCCYAAEGSKWIGYWQKRIYVISIFCFKSLSRLLLGPLVGKSRTSSCISCSFLEAVDWTYWRYILDTLFHAKEFIILCPISATNMISNGRPYLSLLMISAKVSVPQCWSWALNKTLPTSNCYLSVAKIMWPISSICYWMGTASLKIDTRERTEPIAQLTSSRTALTH